MGAGLFAGFVAGLFGIGGGFVVVPALLLVFTLFGVPSDIVAHVAIGTSLATIIVTSLRSYTSHLKRESVDKKIIRDWAPWLIIGSIGGVILAQFMDGRSLKWIFSIGVFIMGIHFIRPLYQPKEPIADEMPKGTILGSIATFLGGFSALLGIGGGTIAVLVMTSCGRKIHQAVGTAAGFGTLIAIPGAIGFMYLGSDVVGRPFGTVGYVNIIAFLAITTMSYITAPIGAKAAHNLDSVKLKKVFGIYLLITSAIVLYGTFVN